MILLFKVKFEIFFFPEKFVVVLGGFFFILLMMLFDFTLRQKQKQNFSTICILLIERDHKHVYMSRSSSFIMNLVTFCFPFTSISGGLRCTQVQSPQKPP